MRVMVNNPGGHTIVRHDLSDTAVKPANKTATNVGGKKTLAVTPAKSAATKTAAKPGSPAKHMVYESGPLLAGAIRARAIPPSCPAPCRS